MTLILNNDDVRSALSVNECLKVMEESYREQAHSRAVNRPTCHSYLAHSLPNSTYSFKSVDGGVEKLGVLALRVTSDVVQEQEIHGSVRLEKVPLAGNKMFVGLVQVFSPNPEHRKSFVEEMANETGVTGELAGSAAEAVDGCDIICSATNSSRPVVEPDWLKAGVHYNSIREFETDLSVLEKCDVIAIHTQFGGIFHYQPPGVIDDMPGVRREKPRDWSKYPEISDLIAGKAPSRTSDRQITFFLNNVGTGVQFAAMGYCAYKAAKEKGLGHEIPSEWFLQDIKP